MLQTLRKSRIPHIVTDNSTRVSICALVRTYHGNSVFAIFSLVSSIIRSATFANATIHFTFADTDSVQSYRILPKIVEVLSEFFSGGGVSFAHSPHKYSNTNAKFPQFTGNDYGFIVTDFVMQDLLAGNCKYLLVTNADNLYAKSFFALALAELEKGLDLAITQFVSRYLFSPYHLKLLSCMHKCGTTVPGANQVFFPLPEVNCIDLGAVLFSAASVRRSGLRFITGDIILDRKRWKTSDHKLVLSALHDRLTSFAASAMASSLRISPLPVRARITVF